MNLARLDGLIRAVCPIEGIDSAGGISFSTDATDDQKAQAQQIYLSNIELDDSIKISAQRQIDALEAQSKMIRGTREYILADIERTASANGIFLPQLQANLYYAQLKAMDGQITMLRHQL